MCDKPDKAKATAEEKALSKVATQEWKIQQEFFQPLEGIYMDNVESMGTDTFQNSVANTAGNATSANVAKQTGNGLTKAAMTGADPTSGRFNSESKALALAAGLNTGAAMASGGINAEAGYMDGMSNIVSIGQGKGAEAQRGYTQLAADATRDEFNRVQTSFDNKNDTLNAGMKIAGVAAASYEPAPALPQTDWSNQSLDSGQQYS